MAASLAALSHRCADSLALAVRRLERELLHSTVLRHGHSRSYYHCGKVGARYEASADDKNVSPPAGDEALISSDDAGAEAGRAPEEEQDEEQAASRPLVGEQSQLAMAMMLCNYKDEAGASGESTIAEGPPEPPPPQPLHF